MLTIFSRLADPQPEIIRILDEKENNRRFGQINCCELQNLSPVLGENRSYRSLSDIRLRHLRFEGQVQDSRKPLLHIRRSAIKIVVDNSFVDTKVNQSARFPNCDFELTIPRIQRYAFNQSLLRFARKRTLEVPAKPFRLVKKLLRCSLASQGTSRVVCLHDSQLLCDYSLLCRERR